MLKEELGEECIAVINKLREEAKTGGIIPQERKK
jgi:hypothetical protein